LSCPHFIFSTLFFSPFLSLLSSTKEISISLGFSQIIKYSNVVCSVSFLCCPLGLLMKLSSVKAFFVDVKVAVVVVGFVGLVWCVGCVGCVDYVILI